MAIVPITNLRGPAARITSVSAVSVPAASAAEVTMSGPDQNRSFAFKVPRGLPGVNALENDEAVATYVAAVDSDTRGALDLAFVQNDTLTVLAPRATGTDQLAALTAAMSKAATFGLTLALNGDHVISGELVPPSGAKIDGRNGTIRQTMDFRSVFRLENVTGVRINNVRADGKTTDYTNASSIYRAAAVYCTGTTNDVIVDGCTFLGFAGAGVYASGTCSDIHVYRMRMTGPGPAHILNNTYNFGAGVVIMDGCANWTVKDCDISLTCQGVVTGHSANNFTIAGNRIHDIAGQHGLYLRAVSNGQIQGNRIWNTALQGMKIQVTETGPGQDAENISIQGNQFVNVGVHAILLSSTVALAVKRVVISGNSIVGGAGGDGVVLDGTAITNVVVSNNLIDGVNYGIRSVGATHVDIFANRIVGVQRTAILASGGQWVTVEGNKIHNPGQAGDTAGQFGISCQNLVEGFIRWNIINDTTAKMRYGIYVTVGDMSVLDVLDNVVSGATEFGYRGVAAAVRAFGGNRFAGTTGAMAGAPTNFLPNSDTSGAALAALEAEVNELKAALRFQGVIRA